MNSVVAFKQKSLGLHAPLLTLVDCSGAMRKGRM